MDIYGFISMDMVVSYIVFVEALEQHPWFGNAKNRSSTVECVHQLCVKNYQVYWNIVPSGNLT